MKLKYKQAKRRRIKSSRFHSVTTFSDYWYCDYDNRWHHRKEIHVNDHLRQEAYGTDCMNVRSVKAFIRKLKQWRKYLPAGVEFILVSRFKNCHVRGKI